MKSAKTNRQINHQEWAEQHSIQFNGTLDLVLDQVMHRQNLGMILRSAQALGVRQVFLHNTKKHLMHDKKVIKISRKSTDQVPLHWLELEALKIQLENYKTIIGIEYTTNSNSIYTIKPFEFPAVCIVGSEKYGISDELLSLTTIDYHIPMGGQLSSLNVACATTTVLAALNQFRIEK